jgi:hypothetical protein
MQKDLKQKVLMKTDHDMLVAQGTPSQYVKVSRGRYCLQYTLRYGTTPSSLSTAAAAMTGA